MQLNYVVYCIRNNQRAFIHCHNHTSVNSVCLQVRSREYNEQRSRLIFDERRNRRNLLLSAVSV